MCYIHIGSFKHRWKRDPTRENDPSIGSTCGLTAVNGRVAEANVAHVCLSCHLDDSWTIKGKNDHAMCHHHVQLTLEIEGNNVDGISTSLV